jgi:hypothetical protein
MSVEGKKSMRLKMLFDVAMEVAGAQLRRMSVEGKKSMKLKMLFDVGMEVAGPLQVLLPVSSTGHQALPAGDILHAAYHPCRVPVDAAGLAATADFYGVAGIVAVAGNGQAMYLVSLPRAGAALHVGGTPWVGAALRLGGTPSAWSAVCLVAALVVVGAP